MNRIFVSAIVALSTTAGSAFAQTMVSGSERTLIESYAPAADLTILSDDQIDSLVAVINSGRPESEKRNYVESFFEDTDPVANLGTGVVIDPTARMVSDSERTLISSYAPDADLNTLSDAEIDSLVAFLNSGRNEGEKRNYAQNVFESAEPVAEAAMISESVRTLIKSYAPNSNLSALGDAEVASLVAYLNSGRSESEKRNYAQNYFQ